MKRSTRRLLVQVLLYLVLAAAIILVFATANWAALHENFAKGDVARKLFPDLIVVGVKNTALYTVIAYVGAFALALLLALMRLSKVAPYRWLAVGYIDLFRGLPAMLVIVFFGLGLPLAFSGFQPPGGFVGAGVLALICVYAAYIAETMRAGIQAVPKGQAEAARSLGMSSTRTMITIILPQAFRIVIPPMTNEFVTLIKDTALLNVIGMQAGQREITTYVRDMMSDNVNATPLVLGALAYIIITIPLTQLVAWLERRQMRAAR